MTSTDTAAHPVSLAVASSAAQQRWAEAKAAQLTYLGQGDRELVTSQLMRAGDRTGVRWATGFAARVFSFVVWSGVVFASVIGVALWTVKIPSRHLPATTTAIAYLMIVAVAAPACRAKARQFLGHLNRVTEDASRGFLAAYVLVLAVAVTLYCVVNATVFPSDAARSASAGFYVHEFTAFTVVTVLGSMISYLILASAYASALQGSGASESLAWAAELAASAVTAWTPAARRTRPADGNPCLDSALLCLLGCAVSVVTLGRGRHLADGRTVKSVICALELAAADIERFAVTRVPRFDVATRRLALHRGLRLSAAIRKAKAPVAGALNATDYAAVGAELTQFLLGLVTAGNGENAALSDGDAGSGRAPLWQRVAGRIWNAVLLAAGAVFLPLLPIYSSDHTAAAGLRYALLTAAVLALAASGTSSSDIIQRNVEKTLPS